LSLLLRRHDDDDDDDDDDAVKALNNVLVVCESLPIGREIASTSRSSSLFVPILVSH